MKPSSLFLALGASIASAQQYAGDTISAYLPTIDGAEVAFFKIPDPEAENEHLTLINYYSHGTDGNRIEESNIKRAVIVIHGLLRDPWNYENDIMNALATSTDSSITKDNVVMMAPYFPNGNDKGYAYPWTEGQKSGQGSTTNALVWSGSTWSAGANNQYPHDSRNTSSYYVLDTLIQYFDNTTLFPNMNEIVLVGHSLGGQMLQRYAAISAKLNTRSPVTLWIGNPSSMAWLDTDRPLYTGDCPDYDDYREGYSNFTEYPMSYGVSVVDQGRAAIQANFQSKRIAWARGTKDFGDQGQGCGAYTTGQDRNERFFYFIKDFPPSCTDSTATDCDTVDLIPVTHDNGQMFKSDAGMARLFYDNFNGDNSRAYDFGYPRQQSGDDPLPNPALEGENGVTNYNTYAGEMTYQGCWTDQYPNTTLALPVELYDNSTNTLESCTTGCVNAGYTIAGVKDSTKCFCGNQVNSESAVLVVDSSCRLTCAGNTAEICGGTNRLSLFANGYPSFT